MANEQEKNTWDYFVSKINFNDIKYKKAKQEIFDIISNYCMVYQRITKNQEMSKNTNSQKINETFSGFLSDAENLEFQKLKKDMSANGQNINDANPRFLELANKKLSLYKFFEEDFDHLTLKESAELYNLRRIDSSPSSKLSPEQRNRYKELKLKSELVQQKKLSDNPSNLSSNLSTAEIVEEYEIYKALNNITKLIKNNPQYHNLVSKVDFWYGGSSIEMDCRASDKLGSIDLSREVLLEFASGNITKAMESVNHELTHFFQEKIGEDSFEIDEEEKIQFENIIVDEKINQNNKKNNFTDAIMYLFDNCDLISESQQDYDLVCKLKDIKNEPNKNKQILLLYELSSNINSFFYLSLANEVDARNGGLEITNSTFNDFINSFEDENIKNYLKNQLNQTNNLSNKKQSNISLCMELYDQFVDILSKNNINLIFNENSTYSKTQYNDPNFSKVQRQANAISSLAKESEENWLVKIFLNGLQKDKNITVKSINNELKSEKYKALCSYIPTKTILNALNNSIKKLEETKEKSNQESYDETQNKEIKTFITSMNTELFHAFYDNVNKKRYTEFYDELFSDTQKYKDVIKYLNDTAPRFLYGYDKEGKNQLGEYLKEKPHDFIAKNITLPLKKYDKDLYNNIFNEIKKNDLVDQSQQKTNKNIKRTKKNYLNISPAANENVNENPYQMN